MHKTVVLALLIVLSAGIAIGPYTGSLSGSLTGNAQTQSSTPPQDIIDHLPFKISKPRISTENSGIHETIDWLVAKMKENGVEDNIQGDIDE